MIDYLNKIFVNFLGLKTIWLSFIPLGLRDYNVKTYDLIKIYSLHIIENHKGVVPSNLEGSDRIHTLTHLFVNILLSL